MQEKQWTKFQSMVEHDPATGCWNWRGAIRSGDAGTGGGYGTFGQHMYAHRASYEHLVGPIPKGLQIDHLCRNRACVNPEHLEVVTPRTNQLRGSGLARKHAEQTHCLRGHEFTVDNTYRPPSGARICRECMRIRDHARYVAHPRQPGTHCHRGHEFTPENTWVHAKTGKRYCRACMRIRYEHRKTR